MSLFEEMKKHVDEILGPQPATDAPAPQGVVDSVVTLIRNEGLSTMVERFEKSGLGGVIGSWVGTGENLPISGSEIEHALGGALEPFAKELGLPVDHASTLLSKVLPGLVDRLTPHGVIDETRV